MMPPLWAGACCWEEEAVALGALGALGALA